MDNIRRVCVAVLLLFALTGRLSAQMPAPWHDPSPHTVQFVTVDENIKLEVLDWGGSGRPVVLLSGLGDTAHVFDDFAPKLTGEYHVYGITRRGYGASSAPLPGNENYSADRLGDDVLAVLDALKLDKPVLVGHSVAGEELSSVGARHPQRIAGLVYLDAAYGYAYYDATHGDLNIDLKDLEKKLQQLEPGKGPQDRRALLQELLQDTIPLFEQDLQEQQKIVFASPTPRVPAPTPSESDLRNFEAFRAWHIRTNGLRLPEAQLRQYREVRPDGSMGIAPSNLNIAIAIVGGEQKYTDINVPVLALYALPHDPGPYLSKDPAAVAMNEVTDTTMFNPQAKAFETGIPSARVVRLPNASHYIFLSNEADVLREIRAFLAGLH